jgi:tetratricopeptide (TPR) repeat protein
MMHMTRCLSLMALLLGLGVFAVAQVEQLPRSDKGPEKSEQPPRYEREREAGESSSRDTKIDISPPKDDAKDHPNSAAAVADTEGENPDDVQEFHPWNPHKAAKDIEVGDFYFRLKNYRAALSRYREALLYKPDDAVANFRIGESLAKLDQPDEAVLHFQKYLKILPEGPLAKDARKELQKLKEEKGRAAGQDEPKAER